MKTLQQILTRIQKAAKQGGRDPRLIRVVAVSKGQPIEKIEEAYASGIRDFGENYVQEWLIKKKKLKQGDVRWHFVGHLQRNKVAKVVNEIAWFHSLDSWNLAQTLQEKLKQPLKTLLEIKLSKDPRKSGCTPEEARTLLSKLKQLSQIDLRGLMTIPDEKSSPQETRQTFRKLFELFKEINVRYLADNPLTELSMGMSHDFEIAIEEGATMIRVGEALFGPRPQR